MRKKPVVFGAVLLSSSFFLSGCFSSPKTTFIDANQKLLKANTYHIDATAGVKISSYFQLNEDEKSQMNLFNQFTLSLSETVDKNVSQEEWNLSGKKDGKEYFSLPVFKDKNALYFQTDGLKNIPLFPKNPTGSFVKIDFSQNKKQKEKIDGLENVFSQVEDNFASTIGKLDETNFSTLNLSNDDKTKGIDQKIQVRLDESDYKNLNKSLFSAFLDGYKKLPYLNESVNSTQISNSEDAFNQAIDALSIDDATLVSSLDKDGNVLSNQLIVDTRLNENYKDYKASINLIVDYSSFGKNVSFQLDPDKMKIISPEDLTLPF